MGSVPGFSRSASEQSVAGHVRQHRAKRVDAGAGHRTYLDIQDLTIRVARDLGALAEEDAARRRVEGREELVRDVRLRTRQAIEERRLARVGVADERPA